ncbi:copper transpport protein [Microbotryomycetes sp. JL201]|nr:copper transpport protein [Microbotryomycetes sp. JL201]
MEHGGHHDGSMACKMNMVWNTDPRGICLVFPSLQVGTSGASVTIWMAGLVLLAVLYEYTRLYAIQIDRQLKAQLRGGASQLFARSAQLPPPSTASFSAGPSHPNTPAMGRRPTVPFGEHADESLLGGRRTFGVVKLPLTIQVKRSLIYTFNLALSFYIMLLLMSFNAQIIAALLCGAFVGHFMFERSIDLNSPIDDDGKGLSCH